MSGKKKQCEVETDETRCVEVATIQMDDGRWACRGCAAMLRKPRLFPRDLEKKGATK